MESGGRASLNRLGVRGGAPHGPHTSQVWPPPCVSLQEGAQGYSQGRHVKGGCQPGAKPVSLGSPGASGGGGSGPVTTGSGGSGEGALSGHGGSLSGGSEGSGNISTGGVLSGNSALLASALPALAGGLGLGGLLGLHGLDILGVLEEEQVDGDIPRVLSADCAPQAQDLACQQPVQQANGQLALVVSGDGAVDVGQGGVGVGEGRDGDVHVGSLLHGLEVGAGVGDQQQTRLLELLGDLVGEGTGGEAALNALGASVLGELEHSTLGVGAGGHDADVGGVLHSHDHAGGQVDLLQGGGHVDDVDTIHAAAPDVVGHAGVHVLGPQVCLGGQKLGDVLLAALQRDHDAEIGGVLNNSA
mmetsp:Transcript_8315/g.21011  ORF Transcript_8315/g.21011 Transcript_8315/m.21011 type:complete len:358 (-) Transcript_8315:59-1132(-)